MPRCGNGNYSLPKIAAEREEYAPTPLPATRPRALTAPLVSPSLVQPPDNGQRKRKWGLFWKKIDRPLQPQTTCDQRQCLLLSRLPPEIRLAIWKEVLGGLRVHVVQAREKRLLGIRCNEHEEDLENKCPGAHECWGMSTAASLGYDFREVGFYMYPTEPVCYANLLPLLKTCRLIYSETVNLLYTENIFSFNHIDTVIRLGQTVLRPRLNRIRVVHLFHYFAWQMYSQIRPAPEDEDSKPEWLLPPHDPDTWNECCRALASLAGLEELYLYLSGVAVAPAPYPVERLLQPLRQVRASRVFEVSMPWDKDPAEVVELDDDMPFRIVSRGSKGCCGYD